MNTQTIKAVEPSGVPAQHYLVITWPDGSWGMYKDGSLGRCLRSSYSGAKKPKTDGKPRPFFHNVYKEYGNTLVCEWTV
jgi:hypothetical protein